MGKTVYTRSLGDFSDLRSTFARGGQYLFFSIGWKMWLVDPQLGAPGFFRDRFAAAIGNPERGNWKSMHENEAMMSVAQRDIQNLTEQWQAAHV